MFTATYSPDDNKLRLSASSRLEPDLYTRVREAGFRWAPKQAVFVAPMWTPAREDLLLELAGTIDDEDTSLLDRAEDRAERFEGYQERRAADAESAYNAAHAIADGIPAGQPILVGHHSEKHARRDRDRIDGHMRKAVNSWKTSEYWKSRAAGAIAHAKYKERPDVRHRRIRTLEAEVRKCKAAYTVDPRTKPQIWDGEEHVYVGPSGRGGRWVKRSSLAGIEAHYSRWIEHYENRLVYERAMLDDQGGIAAEGHNIEIGGQVLIGREWCVVLKVNKDREGRIASVKTTARYLSLRGVEEVQDYKPPQPGDVEKVKQATALPPLCNYPGAEYHHMTEAEWKQRCSKWSDFPKVRVLQATAERGIHRVRVISTGSFNWSPVYLTDKKQTDPPPPAEAVIIPREVVAPPPVSAPREPNKFETLATALREGTAVQVAVADQLFPTPPDIAARMVEMAGVTPGVRILEPSAGTGNLLRAIRDRVGAMHTTTAVEIDRTIWSNLRDCWGFEGCEKLVRADFLQCNGDLGRFDVVLMNPPFKNASDIAHIQHAIGMLKPGGRLVAICANGPRQNDTLKPMADTWEPLPEGTFAGTGVRAVLLSYTKALPGQAALF